jgi:hypothetical protein
LRLSLAQQEILVQKSEIEDGRKDTE